ncbi:7496_t:CDS:2 [Funneliformis mosseae]|uniref:7496_t:CDS:1 n=1 Tax=Funneliformis mosseae TaxID=27381 RepID=A0A9N8V1Z5_FUNMO|nr:7496_t:CDS:2 [Funneliformis mosseae]
MCAQDTDQEVDQHPIVTQMQNGKLTVEIAPRVNRDRPLFTCGKWERQHSLFKDDFPTQELERAEQEVDTSIKNIYESEESSRLAFVYQSEIENLNSYRGGILIAVKSVSGMTPNIPEPIEDGQPNQPRYQVQIQHQNNQPVQICRLSDNPLNHHFPMTDNHFQFGNIPARVFPQPSPPLNVHDGGHLRFIALPPPFPSTPTPPDEDYEILDSNDIRSNRHHEIGSSDDMNEDFDPLGTPVNARDIFDVMRHSGREGFVDIFGREPNQRSREGGHRP